jgi:XrtJ-associated TM-motif-TM protein
MYSLGENTLIFRASSAYPETLTVNKYRVICMCSVLLLACAKPLLAQTGCVDSPENPTVLLGVAGAAGAFFSTVRYRARARRKASR